MDKKHNHLSGRVLAWLLAVALTLSVIPVSALATVQTVSADTATLTTSPSASAAQTDENSTSDENEALVGAAASAESTSDSAGTAAESEDTKKASTAGSASESTAAASTAASSAESTAATATPSAAVTGPSPVETNFTKAVPDETSDDAKAEANNLTADTAAGTILHAWCWSFNTIRENMADIAAAGFSTVQTSPANACVSDHPGMQLMTFDADGNETNDGVDGCWWWQYQPTDWTIGNYQLGTEDEFKAMCAEADKYGIKVIVDVIPNHTTPLLQDVSASLFAAAGGNNADTDGYVNNDNSHTTTYSTGLYHKDAFTNIVNWGDRLQCTTEMMGGLPDVNTENPYFQDYFLNYINELIADGADGMRYDTAKHIGVPTDPEDEYTSENGWSNNFWPVVVGQEATANGKSIDTDGLYIYGEVLAGDNVPVTEYQKYIGTTASSYGTTLRSALASGNLSAGTLASLGTGDASKLVTWVESHDTYCNSHESGNLSDQQIELGWAIIAGRGTGTPLFYSRPDGEDSTNGNYYGNNVLGAKGNDTFKSPIVTAANHFRTDMVGQGEAFTNPTGDSSLLMIARGAAGVVLVNAGDQAAISVKTSLPDGDYTDMVKDAASADWKVEGGKLSGTIGAKTAVFLENLDALNAPSLSAASTTGSSSFQSDTLDVTLTADNGTNLKYTTSEGATGSFKSGDVITIGSSTEAGNNITVTLTATGADGKSYSFDFDFTKTVPNVAYLVLPDGWNADNVYCYAYDSTSNAAWPGEKMELDKDEKYAADGETWYKYTVPADITNPRVIFWAGYSDDDNSCRYPADQAPGLQLSGSMVFRYTSDTDWKWYKYGAEIPTSTPTPTPVTGLLSYADGSQDVYAYVNDSWNTPLYIYAWTSSNTSILGSWPGTEMTKLGVDDDGNAIYYYHNDGTLTTSNVIVNDNNGHQTDNGSYTKGGSIIFKDGKNAENTESKTFDAYITTTDSWTDPVYMYAYDSSGNSNASWPGVQMYYLGKNDDGNNVFGADLPDKITSGNVIFVDKDGDKRSTPDGQAGLALTNDEPYMYDAAADSWLPYESKVTPTPTNTPTPTATPVPEKAVIDGSHDIYAYVPSDWDDLTIYAWTDADASGAGFTQWTAGWPGDHLTYLGYDENGDDVYYYDFPDDADNVNVIFNNNNGGTQTDNFKWAKGESKLFKFPDFTDVSTNPTETPTATPTEAPTATPTKAPTAVPTETPTPTVEAVNMYRLYNPNSGEHFFTENTDERDHLVSVGWKYEGVAWKSPKTSNTPVYRMYNPNAGDHHYTTSVAERDWLKTKGWKCEGIGWYSDDQKGDSVYRLYNPNAKGAGAHHYTTSFKEREYLASIGWKYEGIGWFAVK